MDDKNPIKLSLMRLIGLLLFIAIIIGIIFFVNGIISVRKSAKEYKNEVHTNVKIDDKEDFYNVNYITPNDLKKKNENK